MMWGEPLIVGSVSWQVCAPFSNHTPERRFADVDDAIAEAVAVLGPNVTQVTLTRSAGPDDFDVRHFTWVDGRQRDSGWRCWRAGKFVGAGAAR